MHELTEAELSHFQTFGYVVLRQLLGATEVATIRENVMQTILGIEPGVAADVEAGGSCFAIPGDPLAALIEDRRFLVPAQQLMMDGGHPIGVNCQPSRYVSDTEWHSDTAKQVIGQEVLQLVKFIFYCEPVGADTGALRVIPASHLITGAKRVEFHEAVKAADPMNVPCEPLPTEPGDVIAFDIRLWHASVGGSVDRRSLSLGYVRSPSSAAEMAALASSGQQRAERQSAQSPQHPYPWTYSAAWIAGGGTGGIRRQWLRELLAVGYFKVAENDALCEPGSTLPTRPCSNL
jgi:hypothetical protein